MSPTVYTTLPESSKVRAFEAVDPNEKKRRKKKAAWLIAVLFPYVANLRHVSFSSGSRFQVSENPVFSQRIDLCKEMALVCIVS